MAFKMKGSPMHRNFGVGDSPTKQKKVEYKTRTDDRGTYLNEKGQTQQDIMDKRSKNLSEAEKTLTNYQNDLDAFSNQEGGLTEDQIKSSDAKKKIMSDNINLQFDNLTHSADSIANVNTRIDFETKKRAEESGLFHRTGQYMHDSAHDGNHPTANTFIDDDHNTQENIDRKKKREKEKESSAVKQTKLSYDVFGEDQRLANEASVEGSYIPGISHDPMSYTDAMDVGVFGEGGTTQEKNRLWRWRIINQKKAAIAKKKAKEAKKKKKKAPNYMKDDSPTKQTYDASNTDTRVYDIDQDKYDAWRKKSKSDAPDIRYLGSKENKKFLESYLKANVSSTPPKVKKPIYKTGRM